MNRLTQRFRDDGYVVLRNYLDAPTVQNYLQHSVSAAAAAAQDMPQDAPPAWRLTVKGLHKHSDWFSNLAESGDHVALLKQLLGDDLVLASCAFVDRPTNTHDGINPHIDGAGRPFHSQAGATLWIALDGMSEESGCLYYAAGSHRYEKDRDLEISGFDRNAPGVSPIAVEAGDAIIHHAQTVHWSGGNYTQCSRRAVAFVYYGASAPAR